MRFKTYTNCRRSEKKKIQKHTKGSKERFLLRPNKTGREFSRKSSSSKLRTTQKQTNISLIIFLFLLPQESNRQKISESFVCFCIVRSFEKGDFLDNSHSVLFYLIRKRFLNLLCVFGSFFPNASGQLCFIFCSHLRYDFSMFRAADSEAWRLRSKPRQGPETVPHPVCTHSNRLMDWGTKCIDLLDNETKPKSLFVLFAHLLHNSPFVLPAMHFCFR